MVHAAGRHPNALLIPLEHDTEVLLTWMPVNHTDKDLVQETLKPEKIE